MFFKHPLFWKEWKTAKWWSAIMGSMFVVMFLSLSNSLSQYHERLSGQDGGSVIYSYTTGQGGVVMEPVFLRNFNNNFSALVFFLLPVIIIMSMMLFQSDRKESVGMFISGLPFTKREQFGIKWFVGIIAFTIPFLLATLFTVLIRQVNMGWISQWYSTLGYDGLLAYDTVWIALSIIGQSYLFMITFFSVLMLMQSLMANNIAASIIGSIVVAAPLFIIESGGATLSRILDNYTLRLYKVEWTNLYYFMMPSRNISIEFIEFGQDGIYINPLISNENYLIKIIILVAIAVMATRVGLRFYEKNDNSRNGYLLMFPWVGKILVPGVTLCSALLGNNFINQVIRIKSVPYELITFIISGLIGYLIIKKIIQVSEKYGA